MKLMEYQAKNIFQKEGVNIPKGKLFYNLEGLKKQAEKFEGKGVVKAQVLAGGRGKAGGVQLTNSVEHARKAVKSLLGKRLITHQTDDKGEMINSILFEEQVDYSKEIYFSLLTDREKQKLIFIISSEGGTEIEEIAEKKPEAIKKVWVDPLCGLKEYHVRELFLHLNMAKKFYKNFYDFINKIYSIYKKYDTSLIEINPLVFTSTNDFLALDAKIKIDDNSLFRHEEIKKDRVITEDEKYEVEAKEKGLSFVQLDGDVGCMVNGAGLAMATMDIVKHYGMNPANFLDIGGSSNPKKVIDALKYIKRNKKLKAIFINVFGGITRCDDVANGFKTALKELEIDVPIIIRLTGTNEDEGKKILKKLGYEVFTDLKKSVEKLKSVYEKIK